MAIENNDLFVLQKSGGGELRKATVAALLSEVVTPAVPDEISDLSDVDTTGVTDGQMLVYSTDTWVPQDIPAGNEQTVIISDTAPNPATEGQLYWDTTDATLYVYYDNGGSGVWVPATPVPEAPDLTEIDGGIY